MRLNSDENYIEDVDNKIFQKIKTNSNAQIVSNAVLQQTFLRFNEKSNTYDTLEKLLLFLNKSEKDFSFWKWAIIALHNALYNAMVLLLQGTNPIRVIQSDKENLRSILEKKYGIKQLDVNNTKHVKKIWQHGKLIDFLEAFRRIQKEKFTKINIRSKYFQANKKHKESIKWLNNALRNKFIHFRPQVLCISIPDLKDILEPCLEIIEFCLFKSNNVILDENEKEKFKIILNKIGKYCPVHA